MDESKLDDARVLVECLYDKGHGKQVTVRRMVDVLGVTMPEAMNLFNECMGTASSIYYQTDLPKADCANCKYDALPHEGGHCYMFAERPGDWCAQFQKKK